MEVLPHPRPPIDSIDPFPQPRWSSRPGRLPPLWAHVPEGFMLDVGLPEKLELKTTNWAEFWAVWLDFFQFAPSYFNPMIKHWDPLDCLRAVETETHFRVRVLFCRPDVTRKWVSVYILYFNKQFSLKPKFQYTSRFQFTFYKIDFTKLD